MKQQIHPKIKPYQSLLFPQQQNYMSKDHEEISKKLLKEILYLQDIDSQESGINPEIVVLADKIIRYMEDIFKKHYQEVQQPLLEERDSLSKKLEELQQHFYFIQNDHKRIRQQAQQIENQLDNERIRSQSLQIDFERAKNQSFDKAKLIEQLDFTKSELESKIVECLQIIEKNQQILSLVRQKLIQKEALIDSKNQEYQRIFMKHNQLEKKYQQMKLELQSKESEILEVQKVLEEREFVFSSISPHSRIKVESPKQQEKQFGLTLRKVKEDGIKPDQDYKFMQTLDNNPFSEFNLDSDIKLTRQVQILKTPEGKNIGYLKNVQSFKESLSENKIRPKKDNITSLKKAEKKKVQKCSESKHTQNKMMKSYSKHSINRKKSHDNLSINSRQTSKILVEAQSQKKQKQNSQDQLIKKLQSLQVDLEDCKRKIISQQEDYTQLEGQKENQIDELKQQIGYLKRQLRQNYQKYIIEKSRSASLEESQYELREESQINCQNIKSKYRQFFGSKMKAYCFQIETIFNKIISEKSQIDSMEIETDFPIPEVFKTCSVGSYQENNEINLKDEHYFSNRNSLAHIVPINIKSHTYNEPMIQDEEALDSARRGATSLGQMKQIIDRDNVDFVSEQVQTETPFVCDSGLQTQFQQFLGIYHQQEMDQLMEISLNEKKISKLIICSTWSYQIKAKELTDSQSNTVTKNLNLNSKSFTLTCGIQQINKNEIKFIKQSQIMADEPQIVQKNYNQIENKQSQKVQQSALQKSQSQIQSDFESSQQYTSSHSSSSKTKIEPITQTIFQQNVLLSQQTSMETSQNKQFTTNEATPVLTPIYRTPELIKEVYQQDDVKSQYSLLPLESFLNHNETKVFKRIFRRIRGVVAFEKLNSQKWKNICSSFNLLDGNVLVVFKTDHVITGSKSKMIFHKGQLFDLQKGDNLCPNNLVVQRNELGNHIFGNSQVIISRATVRVRRADKFNHFSGNISDGEWFIQQVIAVEVE